MKEERSQEQLGLPGTVSLMNFLAPWLGKTAYLIPLTSRAGALLGNNGDKLMYAVFTELLKSMDISVVDDPSTAEVMIVPPNGALIEMYSYPTLLRERLAVLPDIDLVIFPSSAYFPTHDPSLIFGKRKSKTLWILREGYSFAHLEGMWLSRLTSAGVKLVLDHDVVITGHDYVNRLMSQDIRSRYTLVAARTDVERYRLVRRDESRAPNGSLSLVSKISRSVPYGSAYTKMGRIARHRELNAAGRHILERVNSSLDRHIAIQGRTRVSDISAPQFATYQEYQKQLSHSSLVVTDRLHVGIPAAILGKEVILVEAGYHKLRGVYERSLYNLPNVKLVTDR